MGIDYDYDPIFWIHWIHWYKAIVYMIHVYHKDVGMLDAQLPHLQGASMFYSPDPAQ